MGYSVICMRYLTILILTALFTASFAAVPAQAWPPVCLGPEVHEDVGRVHVDSYGILTCGADVSVDTGGPCADQIRTAPYMTIYTSSSCYTRIDIKFYDCVWNCGYKTIVDTPLLKVRYYTETDGSESSSHDSARIPIDPCPIMHTYDPINAVIEVHMDKNPCLHTSVEGSRMFTCTDPIGQTTDVTVDRFSVVIHGCGI